MCGIIAVYCPQPRELLKNSLNLLAHRGPDDSGIFIDEVNKIALGHTRLSILDPSSAGHQPMLSDCGSVVLIFNGEIYNFKELRIELESLGCKFKSFSDTEVLLQLYLVHGEKIFSMLNGIFALAIWDSRLGAILVARDALGVKPLYFFSKMERFICSSEIKAILPFIPKNANLDVAALQRYLTFLWCPGDGTPFSDVRKVEPGHAMWVKKGIVERCWKWYQLPVFRSHAVPLSKQTAIKETASHLRQAVHRQMLSDVPVGAFLSGGLDSSSVVAFARELNPDIRCFTISFDATDDKGTVADLPYARRVAEHLRVPLDFVQINTGRMAKDLPAMVAQLDEPLADPACLNVMYISRLASEQGIKVLLSGVGGDDLFTGYRRHLAFKSEGLWSWLPYAYRKRLESFTAGFNQQHLLARRLQKIFSGASLDSDARLVNYFRWINQRDLNSLYTPEFRAALDNARAKDPMLDFLSQIPKNASKLERLLALEQRFFLADHNLIYTDKMSMANGVEVRVPFLDLELVEFAARIPPQLKQRGLESKWILKKAMEPYLPNDVIYRPKTGFGMPLRHMMQVELRDFLADILGSRSLRQRGLFDPTAVQNLIQANNQGKVDATYTLFSLLCIELWCRSFIDKDCYRTHSL